MNGIFAESAEGARKQRGIQQAGCPRIFSRRIPKSERIFTDIGGKAHFSHMIRRMLGGEKEALLEFKAAIKKNRNCLPGAFEAMLEKGIIRKTSGKLEMKEIGPSARASAGGELLQEASEFLSHCRSEAKFWKLFAQAEKMRDAIIKGGEIPLESFRSAMLEMTSIAEKEGLYKEGAGVPTRIALEIRNPINEFLNRRMKIESRVSYTKDECRVWEICSYSVHTLIELELKDMTLRMEAEGRIRRGQ